ncbi:MAG: SDR family NAD(P)-dependent oxidoreductase [Anaerolineae bacterium]|nr:SDR family NAD(P)-dependent oxidoreductase [Anaerolineae bacterium]
MLDQRRRILITGGAGFIGCNLADRLVQDGHSVTVLDNLSRRGTDKNLAWLRERHAHRFQFVQGDIRNPETMNQVVTGMEVIYHLAGQTAVTTSVTNPRDDFEANALGTFNVLEAARRFGDEPALLLSSTNKVYGGMEDVAVVELPTRYTYRDLPEGATEHQPLDFHSPYGCSKGAADQYVRDYHRIYSLPTVVFRQSCIYGPRQMGVEDQGWVAWFLIATTVGRPITIYGDGKQVRDLLYIDDLVNAYKLAVHHIDKTAGQVYNIGGGAARTMSVWAEFRPILSEVFGRAIPDVPHADWRPGDQPVFFCDIRKAQADFGWQPQVGVVEGIRRLAEWVQANRELFG